MSPVPVVIIGSGNIGTDLLFKIKRQSSSLVATAMVGVDPASDGLARARRLGLATTADGIDGLLAMPEFGPAKVLLDATSAGAHPWHDTIARKYGKLIIDLTPAAVGPYVVPPVNLDQHRAEPNLNMVTCGGQATIPVVAAVSRVATVVYAEIVASIASRSAGPGTRANIDEFTETTARAIEIVGGARHGKAVIVLNPADPPVVMRDTVYCFVDGATSHDEVTRSVEAMVADVRAYVPGYRLKQQVQFDPVTVGYLPSVDGPFEGLRVSVFLEVTGAGHYLPDYAGNLDIMTAAAVRTAERMSELRGWVSR
ncbi:acetaldehyde dehydrogenase (acetylating) [Polymorphospora rubra]|uniref:acetaldehyde dehydrogenase (acetylating) n=1 Tax=Polymorphospora rubra TaxID=338584 RepID=UPI0033DFCC0E